MDISSSVSEQDINVILAFAEEQARQTVSEVLEYLCGTQHGTKRSVVLCDEEKPSSLEVALDALRNRLTMRHFCAFVVLYALLMCFLSVTRSDGRLARRPAPPPMPFFRWSAGEHLSDYYGGNGAHPSLLLRHAEIVIALYYAPWSLDSKLTRISFESVAKSFAGSQDLSFAAVNCFAAHGQCRNTYTARMFPVLMAYIGDVALMYNGELAADYIRRWILYIRNPIYRLLHEQELDDFCAKHDDAVLAYFPVHSLLQRSWRYKEYLIASLTASQYEELLGRIGFAIITEWDVASALNFSYEGHIKLFQHVTHFDYPIERNYSGVVITEWVKDQSAASNTLHWLVPDANTMLKAERLQTTMSAAPTLILFTEREPLYAHKSDVSVVEQTVMEYYACEEERLGHLRLISELREGYRRRRHSLLDEERLSCQAVANSSYLSQVNACCSLRNKWIVSYCNHCSLQSNSRPESFAKCDSWNPFLQNIQSLLFFYSSSCRNAASSLTIEKLANVCCLLMGMGSSHKQRVSMESMRERCYNYRLAAAGQTKSKYSIKEKQPGGAPFDQPSFVGLSCAYNNSLRFLAVDTHYYGFLLEKLAIPLSSEAKIIISDSKNEQTLFMNDTFSRESLRRFIESFHNGSLSRHRLSEERLPPQLTASGQAHYDGLRTENRIDATTAQRFSTDLLNASSSQDIVLLLSGGAWHGPSAAVFYVYHTVAYYFRPFEAMIKFFLVDISKNELPWQFKVDRLPALLFFPAKRRSASSVLPRSWPLTVPSVVAFVLARCQPELRWHIALSSCSGRCVRRNVLMLRQHAHQLSNEIAALRHLTTVLQLRATHARLVGTLILRRAAQLRVCRKALRVVQSLWLPSSVRLSERVAELSRESQIIRALFESSIPAHIRGGA